MENANEIWKSFYTASVGAKMLNGVELNRSSTWWVSNLGNVKRTFNYDKQPVIVNTYLFGGNPGSQYLGLSINTAPEKYVHRLVAKNFVDNPHGKKIVNHINGNKLDNRADNLEWVTAKENTQHYLKLRKSGKWENNNS